MAKRTAAAGDDPGVAGGCCRVEAVVSVDGRGQLVLPKAVRDKAGLKAGDKLAVVSWERGGASCCIALIKAEGLAGMVRGFLGPLLRERSPEGGKGQ